MRPRPAPLICCVIAACAPGSTPDPLGAGPDLRIRFLAGEIGCGLPAHDPTPPGQPPADAASLNLQVFDPAGEVIASADAAVHPDARCVDAAEREFACPFDGAAAGERTAQLILGDLPSDSDLTLRAKVLDDAGIVRWSGWRRRVRLDAQGQSLVRLTLTRHAASTCVGRTADARAFGTATALPDGRVLLAGGFSGVSECGARCMDLTATASADLYDPATGLITPVAGGMSVSRGMHSAVSLPDGRVVIVGGADLARLDLAVDADAPLIFGEPGEQTGPRGSFEVFDPASSTFAVRGRLRQARVAPAVLALPDGGVLVTGGGVAPGDGAAPTAEGLKTSDLLAIEADEAVAPDAGPGPSPRSARRGASLIELPGAGPGGPWLLAGGAGEQARPFELLAEGTFAAPEDAGWTAHDPAALPNLYAPAVAPLGDGERVVIAGGAVAEPLAFERRWRLTWRERTEVIVVSAADGAAVIGANEAAARLYLAGASLGDGGALLTGGVVGGSGELVVTDSSLRVGADAVTAPGPRLAQARAGHAAVALPDGTVLVSGGFVPPTADHLPAVRDSVELLNAGETL